MRCDANISVRRRGESELTTRCEIKNLNSFRFLREALAYEFERQVECVLRGDEVRQQTLLWDDQAHCTRVMRGKEDAPDYRYFSDPDLAPVDIA
jgi:aspartyl-tRNA(Asn)/glutamyl-tRNA(Gln) amidotransferase subunit B